MAKVEPYNNNIIVVANFFYGVMSGGTFLSFLF